MIFRFSPACALSTVEIPKRNRITAIVDMILEQDISALLSSYDKRSVHYTLSDLGEVALDDSTIVETRGFPSPSFNGFGFVTDWK